MRRIILESVCDVCKVGYTETIENDGDVEDRKEYFLCVVGAFVDGTRSGEVCMVEVTKKDQYPKSWEMDLCGLCLAKLDEKLEETKKGEA